MNRSDLKRQQRDVDGASGPSGRSSRGGVTRTITPSPPHRQVSTHPLLLHTPEVFLSAIQRQRRVVPTTDSAAT
jgi:hypothetical protein